MRKVKLSIRGNQSDVSDENTGFELMTDGEYSYSMERTVISYLETAITGFEKGVITSFIIEGDTVTLSRSGGFSGDMVFCEGKKHHFVYDTPYGAFTMGVEALSVRPKLDEGGGALYLEYTIDVENAVVSKNTFDITVK